LQSGQLQHPGIVPVYDLGRFADGRPYFTMKLVEGHTLARMLNDRPSPSHDLPRFLGIFEQVCHTVAFAHNEGVIHRDLKPANIMVRAFGEVQVMDWGLAKVIGPASASATSTRDERINASRGARAAQAEYDVTGIVGTPAYMAPEQARGEIAHVDERSISRPGNKIPSSIPSEARAPSPPSPLLSKSSGTISGQHFAPCWQRFNSLFPPNSPCHSVRRMKSKRSC
jgi:serine/threonine protein kinase